MEEIKSEPKRFNKKKVLPLVILGLVAIGLVSAVIVEYFGQRTTTIDVELPIAIEGETTETIPNGMGCKQVEGGDLTIVNKADLEVDVEITTTGEVGVETSYVGTLILAEKTVVFGADKWDVVGDGQTATVEYTVVGDSFSAEVTSGNKIGYVLIYYKDNSNRYDDPARARKIDEVIASEKNLPYENDGNVDEYDYCVTGEYETCHDAKIWYVPSDAITSGELDWSRASEFLFETELIQYNKEGIITMYPTSSLSINPLFDLDCMLNGTVVITTTVDIAE